MIGFTRSVWVRLAVGGAFCLLAVGLVWAVDGGSAPVVVMPAMSRPAATTTTRLSVESTYPVARWTVRVLGVEQTAAHAEAFAWQGEVAVPEGEEVLVIGHADPAATMPHRCLRLRLGNAPERLVWGAGDVTATVSPP